MSRGTRTDQSLAILGGVPRFAETLHVGRPNIGSIPAFLAQAQEILERKWLTNQGPVVDAFERALERYLHVRHVVAVNNATMGLMIAIQACGLHGEVIVPSFTFVASVSALVWQGIRPVFADVSLTDHLLDVTRLAPLVTDRTTGILAVHLWGNVCDVAGFQAFADHHQLTLLYDAAHAFGCAVGATPVANFGAAEVFSFHATKFLNSFEGGAIATNDDAIAAKARSLRNFGFRGYDHVEIPGINGKMPEICAAMALINLDSLPEFVAINQRNYQAYREGLDDIPGITVLAYSDPHQTNYQYVVLTIDPEGFGLTRDAIMAVLHAEHVLARRYFYPGCHRMEPFLQDRRGPLNHTEYLADRVLVLPTGTAISIDAIAAICDIFRIAQSRASAIRRRLPPSCLAFTLPA